MLTPPEGLSNDVLVRVLVDGWGMAVASIDYRAVGFGSHHWEAVDAGGSRWFVTVDELDVVAPSQSEPRSAGFDRLRAALATAVALRNRGATFVVAPIPTRDGEPLIRADSRFGVALYPHVDRRSYAWGDSPTPAHLRGILDLIVALHTTTTTTLRDPLLDDFAIPHRDELETAFESDAVPWESGPYASQTSSLLVANADRITRLLARYDDLVEQNRRQPGRRVLTHGEPHPGNTMLTPRGWVLIDWDTVRIAPPERDLWMLDPGDGSTIGAYENETGTTVQPTLLELYRIRWDLADIAVFVSRFRARHSGNSDDEKSWDVLASLVERLPA